MNKEQLEEKLIAYRRELHTHPELSMHEFETTKRIRNWLEEAGIPILDLPLEVGVVAEIKGTEPGPTIALRADIDALPIVEATDLPFKSKNEGVMHACGHDFHTSSILGAAILLQERRSELKGNVRIIFQPAEENSQGAKYVIENGALEGVEAIFGMHNKPDLPVGTVGVREGALMASVDRFEIDVNGVGSHAGIPNNSIDPIVIGSQIVTGLQTIISRNMSAFHNAVISVTKMNAGKGWNVIPESAHLEGTVRAFQESAREAIPKLMKRTAEGIASSFGATAAFRWYPYAPVVDNAPSLTKVVSEAATELGLNVVEAEQSAGGEDFAVYQSKIPGYFVWMGVDGPKEWHHPSFTLKEDALITAANYFSHLATKVLKEW